MNNARFDVPVAGNLDDYRRLHFVGIGGAGMSAIARVLLARGNRISGSDLRESAATAALRQAGVAIGVPHAAGHLAPATDLVVISSAVPADNPEITEALARGIPVVKRAAVLGALMRTRRTIAVAGTHGKTTTSALIAFVLDQLGHEPTFVLGGDAIDLGTNGRAGNGPWLVAEADEFDGSLRFFTPDIAVVTNVEAEHLDYYGSEAALLNAFATFLQGVRGRHVLCIDDPNLRQLADRLRLAGLDITGYGRSADADWRLAAESVGSDGLPAAIIVHPAGRTAISLAIPGAHNLLNATGALATLAAAGVDPAAAATAAAVFRGAHRRLEVRGARNGVTIVDTYAHHPTEIRADLAALRARYPGSLVVAFQPHLYSRTHLLLDDFATAFEAADRVVVYDIYGARETNDWGVSADDLVVRIGERARAGGSVTDGVHPALFPLPAGSCVVTMGAGDIDRLVPALLGGTA